MSKILIVFVILFTLSGCSLFTKIEYVEVPPVVIHPERPNTMGNPDVTFTSSSINEEPVIVLSRRDAARMAIWLEELLVYIDENNNLLCFYRKDLAEDVCSHLELSTTDK